MCDYSLMAIPNRLAEEGESLVAHRFPTGSVGFASPEDLCKTVQWQGARPLGFSAQNKLGSGGLRPTRCPLDVARYSGTSAARSRSGCGRGSHLYPACPTAYTYRDAIRFANGQEILLQELGEGQQVKVLDLSSGDAFEAVREERLELPFAAGSREL